MVSKQKIELLGEIDADNLDKARSWVKEHFKLEAQYKFDLTEEKLRLIQAILDKGWINRDETNKLQSLGIVFGDAIAEKMELLWVMVEDEYGRDPALMVPKTTILVFPMTAISKRVEDGEKVDVFDLFSGFCERVAVLRKRDLQQN